MSAKTETYKPRRRRAMVRRPATRGFSLLETVMAVAVLGLVAAAAHRALTHTVVSYRTVASRGAVEQLEEEIRSFVFDFMHMYYQCAARGCPVEDCPAFPGGTAASGNTCDLPAPTALVCHTQATSFADRWEAIPPDAVTPPGGLSLQSGLKLDLVTPLAPLPAEAVQSHQAAAQRCANANPLTGDIDLAAPAYVSLAAGNTGIYFCLRIRPTGVAAGMGDVRTMQPMFGEFRFVPMDLRNMQPISCERVSEIVQDDTVDDRFVGAALYYTLYWRARGAEGAVMDRALTGSYFSTR